MTTTLSGLRVLVVEDEYLIADEMEQMLNRAGAQVVGPVGVLDDALALLRRSPHIDFALLDLNLDGEPAWPIADRLAEHKIRFAFVTGYGPSEIAPRFKNVRRLEKPCETAALLEAICTDIDCKLLKDV